MSDIKLFRIGDDRVHELTSSSVAIEKTLQTLIERHLEPFFGVRFLDSEHATGTIHGGRIDTLGIDENNRPVIVEYKRGLNQNVINQGLFYLNWLMDHQDRFFVLVQNAYGKGVADAIEWGAPRLLCIAGDFTKYDEHAIQQIPRSIELIRYRRYGDDLLLFELVNATVAHAIVDPDGGGSGGGAKPKAKTVSEALGHAGPEMRTLYAALDGLLTDLGDDVQVNTLKYYFAYRRIKNFACVVIHPQARQIIVYVKVDPGGIALEPGFTDDARDVGHYGTGDFKITIGDAADLERARPLLAASYEAS